MDIEFVFSNARRGVGSAPIRYVQQAAGTVGLLLRRRPRIVFVQSPPTFAVMTVAAYSALTRTRYVVDAHSSAMLSRYWTRPRWVYRYLARRATATIVTNDHFAEIVRGYRARALVIPDIPTTFTDPGGSLMEGFNVLVVNTFSPDEPLGEVMTAAATLPEVTFHVTGDTRRAPGRVPRNAPANVRFTDFLPSDAYYALMASSQAVMCLTTRDHTMQRGACEALWMGRPIITSAWPLLQSYFSRGAVYVENTAEAIRHGVEDMVRSYPQYAADIEGLRRKYRREWRSVVSSLLQLLGESSAVDAERIVRKVS
jgi:glycosyltransferase involved in cell wall biosynthesis